ncbi:ATP-binding protein, partial [Caulobacter sp. 17J65-9]|uniref:hybrid sensor histidine kinase/response regulator n=1 Tax=Caulobacter sp. 17J65-9 TaxID=2709382 RepID=UPI0013CBD090
MSAESTLDDPRQSFVGGRADILAVLQGRAEALMVEYDQASAAVASVFLGSDGDAARAVCAPGETVEDLVADGPLAEAVGAGLAAARGGAFHAVELETQADTGPSWSRLVLTPRYKGHGRLRGFSLMLQNVTEARRGALDLTVARERLAAILNNAADGVVVIDAEGRIEEVNAAAARIFGWPEAELPGQPVTCLMDAPYSNFHAERVDRYIATGVSGILNVGPRPLPARRRDGSLTAIELSIGEVWIAGQRKFIGVCREVGERLRHQEELREANRVLAATIHDLRRVRDDLHARKQAADTLAAATEAARKQAEAASLAKSRFLAKASHELRTPLNGILALAEVLCAKVEPGEARELADVVARSSRDLVVLLNEVLDLSSLELGAVTLKSAPFSLSDLVGQAAAVWSVAAGAKGLDFRHQAPERDVRVLGDRARLTQILSNLLGNAVKFTSRGLVELSAQTEAHEAGFVTVRLVVSDTGPGIDEDVRARLFEPFVHAGAPTLQRQAGAGLGLSICRELVDLMGGRVWADAVGGGARMTVEVELPIAPAEAAADPAAVAVAPAPDDALTVLVADDHPVNRQVMGVLLERLGLPHAFAEDGVEAVE